MHACIQFEIPTIQDRSAVSLTTRKAILNAGQTESDGSDIPEIQYPSEHTKTTGYGAAPFRFRSDITGPAQSDNADEP